MERGFLRAKLFEWVRLSWDIRFQDRRKYMVGHLMTYPVGPQGEQITLLIIITGISFKKLGNSRCGSRELCLAVYSDKSSVTLR